MADNSTGTHAKWAASATARNWRCSGAMALSAIAPEGAESVAAARGTATHDIAERALLSGWNPLAFLGEVVKTKKHSITIDEELVGSATEYVEYVRQASEGGKLWIEEKFKLDAISPPYEAGGTGDAVIYHAGERRLEIVDLKNGQGIVDVRENKQLRTYALGAMLHHPGLDVALVTATIVQPLAPHKDGRIRSETFTVSELIDWTNELLAAMRRSKEAEDAYAHVTGGVTMDEWADKYLKPGNCKFCPAEGFCPTLKKRAQGIAKMWFDDRDQAHIGNTPDLMDPQAIADTLDQLSMLEDWIKAVRGLAHNLAENGKEIPNYVLVEKIGNRKWASADAKVIADLSSVVKLTDDQIYEPKELRSVAQIEKILGAKRRAEIENMWHRPVTGKNLVRADKTTRAPVQSRSAQYFEPQ